MALDHLGREALAHLQGGRAVSGPSFDVCLAQVVLNLSVVRCPEPIVEPAPAPLERTRGHLSCALYLCFRCGGEGS